MQPSTLEVERETEGEYNVRQREETVIAKVSDHTLPSTLERQE